MLLIPAAMPAMEVSGTLALRGGGGVMSRERGWYSVAVESCLLIGIRA